MKTAKQLQEIAQKSPTKAIEEISPLLEETAEGGDYRMTRVGYLDNTSADQLRSMGFSVESVFSIQGDSSTVISWAHYISENTKGAK